MGLGAEQAAGFVGDLQENLSPLQGIDDELRRHQGLPFVRFMGDDAAALQGVLGAAFQGDCLPDPASGQSGGEVPAELEGGLAGFCPVSPRQGQGAPCRPSAQLGENGVKADVQGVPAGTEPLGDLHRPGAEHVVRLEERAAVETDFGQGVETRKNQKEPLFRLDPQGGLEIEAIDPCRFGDPGQLVMAAVGVGLRDLTVLMEIPVDAARDGGPAPGVSRAGSAELPSPVQGDSLRGACQQGSDEGHKDQEQNGAKHTEIVGAQSPKGNGLDALGYGPVHGGPGAPRESQVDTFRLPSLTSACLEP